MGKNTMRRLVNRREGEEEVNVCSTVRGGGRLGEEGVCVGESEGRLRVSE